MAQIDTSNPLRRFAASLRDAHDRHRERHRPSGFGFVFADCVDYLNTAHWDGITKGGTMFLRRDVLRVIEQHRPDNIHPRYALIFRGEKPVAALSVQIVNVTGNHLHKHSLGRSLLKRALRPATKTASSVFRERLVVTGNLLSWGFHGIVFAGDEDPAQIWPGVAEALYRIRRAERLMGQSNFALVKDCTAEQTAVAALRRFSYRPLQTEPNMVLAINPAWRTYDDYLAALDAKYRRNAKDQIKKLTGGGCRLERLSELLTCSKRLHELYLAVHDNASVRLITLPEGFLPALSGVAGDNFRCTVALRGDKILGFVTSLRDGETAIGYYLGLDRAAAATGLPIYLRLLHATISDAIEWRCRRLSLGRTALEPKAALGAKPEPMSVWLRHRVPALNWTLRGLLGAVPHAEAPERNPFKASAALA